jgi:catechol 2,3-dioxygenase-like lactoylglutathione lyase family enzyme
VLRDASLVAFVPVSDLTTARAFYEATLGLAVMEENPFAVLLDANGTPLRLIPVPGIRPQPFTVVGWNVADIEEAVAGLADRGVTFTRYDGTDQDDQGIWTTPGGERVAWFVDPDGNTLSLTGPAGR